MPSVKQSARVNLNDWTPVQNDTKKGGDTPAAPTPPDPQARSAYMLASMPLMASTGDAFARQFYGAGSTPQQRILPAKRGGGA